MWGVGGEGGRGQHCTFQAYSAYRTSVKIKIKVRIMLPTLFCRRYPDLSAVELWLSKGKG